MGQYYIPTLIAEDGTVSTFYSHQYDNGLKLIEHSYNEEMLEKNYVSLYRKSCYYFCL